LGEHHEEFRAAGGDVVAVFQYRAEPTYHFCRKRGVPFDCLGDPEREGYHAVGLERGGAREYVGPQLAKGFLRAARHGAFVGVPKGDVAQRPGTFVVAPDGTVAYAHYNKDSSDSPPLEDLLEVVRSLGAQSYRDPIA
jgi:peroxiredoxin